MTRSAIPSSSASINDSDNTRGLSSVRMTGSFVRSVTGIGAHPAGWTSNMLSHNKLTVRFVHNRHYPSKTSPFSSDESPLPHSGSLADAVHGRNLLSE